MRRVLSKGPGLSGNRAFLSLAIFAGLSNLSLGLVGTFLAHPHPLFWALLVSGIGSTSMGIGETLPERLLRVAVILRLAWLSMGVAFAALLLVTIATSL